MTLERLHARISSCLRCDYHRCRIYAVPGEGPVRADAMVVGEAPGRTEDEQGRPFVGRSGRFFDQVLRQVGIDRGRLFITSTVKCLPDHPGPPREDSIDACIGYLHQQADLVKPAIVVLMGRIACRAVLGIEDLRVATAKTWRWRDMLCCVTHHPAAAMRFPEPARSFRSDWRAIRRRLDGLAKHSPPEQHVRRPRRR